LEKIYEEFKNFALTKGYKSEEIDEIKNDVLKQLEISISEIIKGDKGRYEALLKYDKVVNKALELLSKVRTTSDMFNYLKAQKNE
jgi:hypothetical protein